MHNKHMRILLVACLFLIGGFIFTSPLWFDANVYRGVILEGVDLGGKSRTEVMEILKLWQRKDAERTINIYYGDTVFRMDAQKIDFSIDVDGTLDELMNVGRRGSLWEKIKNIGQAASEGYPIPIRIRYNEHKLETLLEEWKEAVEKPPRNAAFSLLTGSLVPQEQGRRLETDTLRQLILKALKKPDEVSVAMPVTPLKPQITLEDIKHVGINELISTFTTVFNAEDKNRTANIRRAAENINGRILYPKDVFSFNEIVGPRDKEHGFKEALEIVDNQFVPGIGGGICQVSSTLYNAVLLADLEIVERYNHSKPLGYIPLGRDATVSFGSLDFKFANNSAAPLMIMAQVEGNKLYVGIFGQRRLDVSVEILSAERQVIPPTIVKKQDQNLFLGESQVDKEGKPGYEVTTLRVVRRQGQEIRREVLSKDRYLPEDMIVKVGTKMPPFAAQEQPVTGG